MNEEFLSGIVEKTHLARKQDGCRSGAEIDCSGGVGDCGERESPARYSASPVDLAKSIQSGL
jgi:hypothetical protein